MASCQQPPRGARALTPAEQADWTRDSLKYVTDSLKWVRDSLVRDSLARAVNTDSLYRLYRSMLHAPAYGNTVQWDTSAVITLPGSPHVHLNF